MPNLSLKQFEAQSFSALTEVAFSRLEEFRRVASSSTQEALLSEEVRQANFLESTVLHLRYLAEKDSNEALSAHETLNTQLDVLEEGCQLIEETLNAQLRNSHVGSSDPELERVQRLNAVLNVMIETRNELLKEQALITRSS